MASKIELLKQIADSGLTHVERVMLRCRLARQFEETGNYRLGREALGELWRGLGELPSVEGLNDFTAAELILRAGVLSGWLGSNSQLENAQELSKNLISKSLVRFEALGDKKKVAEAQAELGVCYWREGAFDEASVVLREALVQLSDEDGALKASALLRLAIVEISSLRLRDALHLLESAASLFEQSDNHTLRGRFHNELATVLRDLGAAEQRRDYTDRALIEYAAASYHFEQAGHRRYQGCVENNLGSLFGAIGKYEEAHEHIDRAQALFTSLKDASRYAVVDETRARVYLAEGKVVEAERVARAAVGVLERGGEQALLAEALTTQGVALARLGRGGQARLALQRAVEVADGAGDREGAGRAALAVVEELFGQLGPEDLRASFEQADALLEGSQHPANHRRLLACARRLLFRFGGVGEPQTWEGVQLDRFVSEFEGRLVERALRAAGGVITRAAQLLGIKRQRLSNMLHTRHRRLLAVLSPAEQVGGAPALSGQEGGPGRAGASGVCCFGEAADAAEEEG